MPATYSSKYEDAYPWSAPVSTDDGAAECTWCKRKFRLDSMGNSAYISHQKSKTHQGHAAARRNTVPLSNFMKKGIFQLQCLDNLTMK